MKKAKIMLAAVAIFAVVGGSLAFKAKKAGVIDLYVGPLHQTVCAEITTYTSTQGAGTTLYFTTQNPNPDVTTVTDCSIVSTKFTTIED